MEHRLEDRGTRTSREGRPPRIYLLHGAVAATAEQRQAHLSHVAKLGFDWVCWAYGGDPAVPPTSMSAHRGTTPANEPETLLAVAQEARERHLKMMAEAPAHSVADLSRLAELDLDGLLIASAWRLRANEWRSLLPRLRAGRGMTLVAETLGRPLEDVLAVAATGFDYLLNSVAWWDLREPWFFDQHEKLAGATATLSSPEPLRGMRLIHQLAHLGPDERRRAYRARYLLAATASSGLVCPMGFEIAMPSPIDARTSRPADWDFAADHAPFDLSADIARINALKAELPALRGEGPLWPAAAPESPVLALVRKAPQPDTAAICLLINTTGEVQPPPTPADLALVAETARFRDALARQEAPLTLLEPHEARLLAGALPTPAKAGMGERDSERLMQRLAQDRVAIEHVAPEIDGGRFPVKRLIGDSLQVEADIFSDGHDVIGAALLYRAPQAKEWLEAPMSLVDNDRWQGSFLLDAIGRWQFTIRAWRDLFASWRQDAAKKHDAGQAIQLELVEGCELVRRYRSEAAGDAAAELDALLARIDRDQADQGALLALLMDEETLALMRRVGLRNSLSSYGRVLEVVVDRAAAGYAAWYEMMPRSQSPEPGRHGTFDDVIARLPYVRDLGFDVLYFPPIHPIGRINRKGRNNSLTAAPDDPGSPYAIGSEEGGHTAIHPELGDFADFRRLVEAAHDHGLEIALDFAIQCAPDHPWIKEHPEWFDWRPDGTIKFAENPPKKYEDIVNVHFYRDAFPGLWQALRDVVRFWIEHGVKTFRVDNPHTKPLPFWEWLIRDIQEAHPEVVFLSEAFTRPKMMKRLAKVGFTQSYSYFTWRNTKQELTDYLTELTHGESSDYMRPNFFVNTPDINPVYLQTSGRPGFQVRLVLAATLSPVYGVYNGFELCEATPVPGKEEYLNSEKYEIKAWDWDRPGHIREDIALINRARRDNPALRRFTNLNFLNAWNDNILAYYKTTERRDNIVIVAVNLDPHHPQGADFEVPLWELGLPDSASVPAVDLVDGRRFTWHGKVQHVRLDPQHRPYALWRFATSGTA